MRNYYEYWSKRFIKDGLKSIKLILGLGITFLLADAINLPISILFFGYVLTDTLINKS